MADQRFRDDGTPAPHFRERGPRGYQPSDERIAEEVVARLTDDPALDASEIEVSVTGGEVTLTGTVADRRDRRRAEDLVECVRGVSYVQNNIRLAGAGFGADEPWRRPGGSSGRGSAAGPTDAGHAMTTGTVAGTDRAVASTEAPNSASHVDPGGAVSEGPSAGGFHATPQTQEGP
jgi:BON domain